MPRKPAERPNPYFTFLRRLRAGGRSNMYGAIPYLTAAFGCDRNEAFRIVCEWIDAQAEPDGGPAVRQPAQTARRRGASASTWPRWHAASSPTSAGAPTRSASTSASRPGPWRRRHRATPSSCASC